MPWLMPNRDRWKQINKTPVEVVLKRRIKITRWKSKASHPSKSYWTCLFEKSQSAAYNKLPCFNSWNGHHWFNFHFGHIFCVVYTRQNILHGGMRELLPLLTASQNVRILLQMTRGQIPSKALLFAMLANCTGVRTLSARWHKRIAFAMTISNVFLLMM